MCLLALLLVAAHVLPVRAVATSPATATHTPGGPCQSSTIDTTTHLDHSSDGVAAAADHASLCAALCAVASQVGMPVAALPASAPPRLPAPTFFEPLALGEARPPATPPPIR